MSTLRNSVQLIGRLGKDPEAKTFDSGAKRVTFSLATNDTFKNQKGEKVDETQWHNLVIWGKLGDVAEQYLKKGAEIAIEGKLIHRTFEVSGEKKYVTEIIVNEFVMLGDRPK